MSGTRSDVRSDVRADARADEGVGGILYGMWFDGSNDTVLFDGSPFNTKTKGRVTGTFQTTDSGYRSLWALTDETDTNSDVSIFISVGKIYVVARNNGSTALRFITDDRFDDGALHTYDLEVSDSGNTIKVDGILQDVTYTTGSASTVKWAADVGDLDVMAIGVRQESSPDGYMAGFIGATKVYDEDGTTVLWSVNGYGNTNADWLDQVGSNDGTVSGSPSRAISVNGGATWAEES